MSTMKFKDVPKGQTFYWDEGDTTVPAPKVKVGDFLYMDPAANGGKHPIRVSAKDQELTVLVCDGPEAAAS